MFHNKVLRKIFGLDREMQKLHNEEHRNLYSLPHIGRVIKNDEMGNTCSTSVENENCEQNYCLLITTEESTNEIEV
jgi:hypothetical protein